MTKKKSQLEQDAEEQSLQLLAHKDDPVEEYETPETSTTEEPAEEPASLKKPVTPIPKRKFLLVSLVIMAEAFGYTLLTPILPFMILDWKVTTNEDDVGYFVGILVSAVSVAQLFSGIFWGRVSDTFGRRPVILIGLLSNVIFLFILAFCSNFYLALGCRIMAGLLDGVIPSYTSYIYDSTDETNQEKGFIIVGVVWGIISVIAPAIGGYLAPSKKFSFLRGIPIFMEFPYLLAVLVPAVINLLVFFMSLFFLEESKELKKKKKKKKKARQEEEENRQVEEEEEEQDIYEEEEEEKDTAISSYYQQGSIWSKLRSYWFLKPTVIKVLILYSLLSFALSSFDEIFPLWASTKREFNGLNWDSSLIGLVMSTAGITSLGTLLFYPILVSKFGILRSYQLMCLVLVATGLVFPFNSDLAKVSPQAVIWISVAIGVLLRTCCGEVLYTSQYILTSNSVTPEQNGAMNGLASTLGSVGWALGPFISGVIFSWSLGWFPEPGSESWITYIPFEKLVFLFMTLVSVITFIVSLMLPSSIEKRLDSSE